MYKIIGADQREYGPVTADQIREWIAQGRASGATLAQAEGSTDWQPLSTLPEFASNLADQAASLGVPAAAPASATPGPAPAYSEPRSDAIDIGRCVMRSWELFKQHFGLLIGATFLFLLVIIGVNQLIAFFTRGIMESLLNGNVTAGGVLLLVLWNIPEMALSGVLTGGYYALTLKLIRGHQAGIGDVFAGFGPSFVQLALAGIVVQFLVVLGMLACILPGIYLSVAWIFNTVLIIDRRMDFWNAMETSRKAVTPRWWITFCLLLVIALMNVVGFVACCVGLLVALPVSLGALLYAYEDIFGGPGGAPV